MLVLTLLNIHIPKAIISITDLRVFLNTKV
jgi:hypothetical protein